MFDMVEGAAAPDLVNRKSDDKYDAGLRVA